MSSKDNLPSLVPANIGDRTINELINDPNTEIKKKNNQLRAVHKTPDAVQTFTYSDTSGVQEIIATNTSRDNISEKVEALNKAGKKQIDIADTVGITQPRVSQILKQKKNTK
jgi:predicted XRE-type DNA-binding protein